MLACAFFLPTQSKSLFSRDMNTQNSNFGGLNVKHDELKKEPSEYFLCYVLAWMMMKNEETTSSSILKIHKTQRNRRTRNKFIIMPFRNIINREMLLEQPSFLFIAFISLLAKISDRKMERNMLISIIIHSFRPGIIERSDEEAKTKRKIKMKRNASQ